jgi:serine protease AprX
LRCNLGNDIVPFRGYDGLIKPDILAPGQGLVAIGSSSSKLYKNELLRDTVAPYLRLSGSSMATGVASGVVALMIGAHRTDQPAGPALTPNTVKAILQ